MWKPTKEEMDQMEYERKEKEAQRELQEAILNREVIEFLNKEQIRCRAELRKEYIRTGSTSANCTLSDNKFGFWTLRDVAKQNGIIIRETPYDDNYAPSVYMKLRMHIE